MVPGSQDIVEWLAQGLAFLLLEEREGSVRRLSDELTPLASLEAEVARETGVLSSEVADLIEGARQGRAARLHVGPDTLVLAWPVDNGVRIMIAPDSLVLAERAGAADLAAGVTHEMANSLTAIAGWAQLAAGTGQLPERASHALEVVQRSASDALSAARTLLSAMRNSVAPSVAATEPTGDLAAALGQVLETLRPSLAKSGIEVDADCAPGIRVGLPPTTLRSVLDNLVRNAGEALRDADVRAPRITVTARETADGGELVVTDNGPGIAPGLRAHVFDRYMSTKETGTGLGLALIRDAVEGVGGTIHLADSESGARFVVRMPSAPTVPVGVLGPVWPADPAEGSPHSRTRHSPSGVHRRPAIRGRSVLVVDDDQATRSMVETALALSGAIVTTAEGYEHALSMPASFDIALVDVQLGDGRGDELIGELRQRGLGLAVILTGSHRALAPEAQPDAVLRKPFELGELELLLDALLNPDEPLGEESQG